MSDDTPISVHEGQWHVLKRGFKSAIIPIGTREGHGTHGLDCAVRRQDNYGCIGAQPSQGSRGWTADAHRRLATHRGVKSRRSSKASLIRLARCINGDRLRDTQRMRSP
ncbi:hypothetical protein BD310DRAFT_563139 [Dichomitus squalens]|uniref:Uncharacterized protein n=1 Tax=Dichomitus squalens TaxID=114155 RepID=A0A4V2K7T1_9APHY|nr:hypothetical protein BD310DRAFT_563139 [Dichomitus squalens]